MLLTLLATSRPSPWPSPAADSSRAPGRDSLRLLNPASSAWMKIPPDALTFR